MSRPTIAECYDDVIKDPSLLQLFPEKKYVISSTPTLGCSPIQDYFSKDFCLLPTIASPTMCGKVGMEFITSNGQKISGETILMVILVTDGVGEGKLSEHGDHLPSPQSSQDGGFQCNLCPSSTQLTRAKCGCNEEVHQHSLYPSRVLPSPLFRCEHSLWGHILCPIPTGLAIPMQVAPLLWHWGGHVLCNPKFI